MNNNYLSPKFVHKNLVVTFYDIKSKEMKINLLQFQDLLHCGQGDTVVSILIDLNGFWTYENREAMASEVIDESSETH